MLGQGTKTDNRIKNMKLYAFIENERGTRKGQGGNKSLVLYLHVGSRKDSREIAHIVFTKELNERYSLTFADPEEPGNNHVLKRGWIKRKP